MSMRVLLSLETDDEELYNNLIRHYKSERLLGDLVKKCLSAYFYNSKLRALVNEDIVTVYATPNDIPDEIKNKEFDILDLKTDKKFALIRPDYIRVDLSKFVDVKSHDYEVARFTQVLAKWLLFETDSTRLSDEEKEILRHTSLRGSDIKDVFCILNSNIVEFDLELKED